MENHIDLSDLLRRIELLEEEVNVLKAQKPRSTTSLPDIENYINLETAIDNWLFAHDECWRLDVFDVLLTIVRQKAKSCMCLTGRTLYMKIEDKWVRISQDNWDDQARQIKEKILVGFKNQNMRDEDSDIYIECLLSLLQFKLSCSQRTHLSRLCREIISS